MAERRLTDIKPRRRIGWMGTISRLAVGIALLAILAFIGMTWTDVILGLVAIPGAVLLALSLRGTSAAPLRLYGPEGHMLNCGIGAVLFVALTGPALAFYGTSMIVAAARGYAGCELLALANAITRREDEIACPVFAPVDALERQASRSDGNKACNRGGLD